VTRNTEPDVKLQIGMSMGTTTEPTTSAKATAPFQEALIDHDRGHRSPWMKCSSCSIMNF
jgi:hypothetical protein